MNRRVLAGINVGTHHQVEGATFFALIGSQRCGSNFMRELLGTNPQTIVHGEIFMPFPLPNCWHYFTKSVTYRSVPPMYAPDAMLLFDDYLVHLREDVKRGYPGKGCDVRAVGLDIKYNQIRAFSSIHRPLSAKPLLLDYFINRGIPVIHMVRRNMAHQALSLAIAEARDVYHNYGSSGGELSQVEVDPRVLLGKLRWVSEERQEFSKLGRGLPMLEVAYEDLAAACRGVEPGCGIDCSEEGSVLGQVAEFLDIPPEFSNPASLRKVIDRPYAEILSNYEEILAALRSSDFASLAESI